MKWGLLAVLGICAVLLAAGCTTKDVTTKDVTGQATHAANAPQAANHTQAAKEAIENRTADTGHATRENDVIGNETLNVTPSSALTRETEPSPVEKVTQPDTARVPARTGGRKVTVANWNLQIFGSAKASNDKLMQFYASVIDDYDIVFVQEIRNKDQTAFPRLCSLLPDYDCMASSRAGRTASKEQYGVIYRKDIEVHDWKDFNPDSQDRWERPPIEVTFDIGGYELVVYNVHTKPEDAPSEISHTEEVARINGNVIVMGDLNADCGYYNASVEDDFASWHWVVEDYEDTTVSSTDCAYDRIILNDDSMEEYAGDGIYSEGITPDVSDHYLVWVELET